MKLLTLFALTFTMSAWATKDETFSCPPESFKTEFVSPISYERRLFCSKRLDSGELVQHGPDWTYDPDGKLIDKKWYVEGRVNKLVQAKVEAEAFEATPVYRDRGFMITAIQELLYALLPIKAPDRGLVNHGGFATTRCYSNSYTQKRFYGTRERQELPIRFKFNEKCSLHGEGELLEGKFAKLHFKVRLSHYEAMDLPIQTLITYGEDKVSKIKFEIRGASLLHKDGNLEFDADYELLLTEDMRLLEPHAGEVRVKSEAGIELDLSYPLKLARELDKL